MKSCGNWKWDHFRTQIFLPFNKYSLPKHGNKEVEEQNVADQHVKTQKGESSPRVLRASSLA